MSKDVLQFKVFKCIHLKYSWIFGKKYLTDYFFSALLTLQIFFLVLTFFFCFCLGFFFYFVLFGFFFSCKLPLLSMLKEPLHRVCYLKYASECVSWCVSLCFVCFVCLIVCMLVFYKWIKYKKKKKLNIERKCVVSIYSAQPYFTNHARKRNVICAWKANNYVPLLYII